MQTSSLAGAAFRAVAFAALNKFDTLNSVANKLWGTNRDTLAQKVLRDAIHVGLDFALSKAKLGDRSATLVPLASKILFDNTSDEMRVSIKSLTQELLQPGTNQPSSLTEKLKAIAVDELGDRLASTVTEDHFTEKLLATMFSKQDWKPLEAYMEKSLSAVPLKGFFGDRVKRLADYVVKNVLQRTVAKNAGLDQSKRPEFHLLAAQANAFLTDGDYKTPLKNYFAEKEKTVKNYFADTAKTAWPDAVETAARGVARISSELAQTAVKASEALADGYAGVKDRLANQQYAEAAVQTAATVLNTSAAVAKGMVMKAVPALAGTAVALTGITVRAAVGTVILATPGVKSLYQGALSEAGRIYHAAAGEPAYKSSFDVYAKDIEQASQQDALPAMPEPDARTSDSQWANALVKQHSVVQFALPAATTPQHMASLDQALEENQIGAARKEALADLTDKLSTAQLAPFGLMGASHQVAHNLVSGQLSRLASESQAQLPLAGSTTRAMASALDTSLTKTVDLAGYRLANTYTAHVGRLALDFPEGVYSYADASKDQLSGAGNLWWGENITLTDRAELRKLYNTCGGNEQLTLGVSRYLDPAMASQALAAPVLAEMDPQGTGLLQLREPSPAGLQLKLKLADSMPQYQYQLRRDGEDVQVTISATWDIAQYGAAGLLRSPQGGQPSQLTASVTITVPASGPAHRSEPALQCTIRNEFEFSAHGQWVQPSVADTDTDT